MNAEPAPPNAPWRHDAVTIPCPLCATPFVPAGKRRYCRPACVAAAYRRRKRAAEPAVAVPAPRPAKPITVYECATCGARALGEQRCDDCSSFMHRVGLGGACPHCDEPVAVTDLLDQEASR